MKYEEQKINEMKNIKNALIYLLTLNISGVMAQIPQTDPHWTVNNTFSDEFNGSKKNIWGEFTPANNHQWGIENFRSQNIQYESEGGRTFLRLVAEMVNGIAYSGGMWTGYEEGYLGLGYGYYEIEARVLGTPDISSGLWPAFWTNQGSKNPPPYRREEIDIFEPTNCQINNKKHVIGYHYPINENESYDTDKMEGIKNNVDMSLWHKYAVEWLPERLAFYLDDEVFFVIGGGQPTPYLQNTNVYIDLQVGDPTRCPPSITNGILGYFDINYFRYYKLKYDCKTNVTQIPNFNTYNYAVKKSISLSSTTTIPPNSNITLRATDFIELQAGFEVPAGAELYLDITPCDAARVARTQLETGD